MLFGKDPGLPVESFWTTGKVISGVIALVYVALALVFLGPPDALETVASCAVPILMIWMPEMMGDYTGWGVLHGRPIARPSPAGLVWLAGWVTLLLPPVLMLIALR
jgi:hypothetical protein